MSFKKIYISIPDHEVAGGVESLYQLADVINNCGGSSIVVFDNPHNSPIPTKYQKYNIVYAQNVEDSQENIIVYPEVWTERLVNFSKIKKSVWWLSVDNNHNKFQSFDDPTILHFYQSFYALSYLMNKNSKHNLPLFDYISQEYIESKYDINKKENIVCYNPIKGKDITNYIIGKNPDISFVPLVNMSYNEVINTLLRSKVYIDFGHHPGRDRIPRESTMLGNCVITNHTGSAGFYNDMPIDDIYKLKNNDEAGNLIKDCFSNFEQHLQSFSLYRSNIKNQKEQLYNLVKQTFL